MEQVKQIRDLITSIFPVSSNSMNDVIGLIEHAEYKGGDCFISKGRKDHYEYFVTEGICRSYLLNPEGEEITIGFFGPMTVLSPFVTRTVQGISSLNFQALTDIKIARIDAQKFLQLMVDNLEIREFGNMVLKRELQRKVDKEIGLASLTAKERLIRFRKEYPLFENLVPHTAIATYLGITNISLSRLRKDLMR